MEAKKIAIIILIILALGTGGYYFYTQNNNFEPAKPTVSVSPTATLAADKNLDSDKDGLPDSVEKIIKTNPNKIDTDGDGYNDLAEIKNGHNPLMAGAGDKYTPEEWQALKDKIKTADKEFYEKEFVSLAVSQISIRETPNLSEDRKNIIVDGNILLTIGEDAIFSFFKNKSGLCDEKNINTTLDNKTFCEDKEIFKSKTSFASIVLSSDKTKIGFTIESDELSPDKVAGIFYPNRINDKIYFLTNYYLGNEFISFSPTGVNFVYRDGCYEGYCGLFVKNSETLESKISFNSGDGGIVNYQFIRWLSDNEIEYKLDKELKQSLFK